MYGFVLALEIYTYHLYIINVLVAVVVVVYLV